MKHRFFQWSGGNTWLLCFLMYRVSYVVTNVRGLVVPPHAFGRTSVTKASREKAVPNSFPSFWTCTVPMLLGLDQSLKGEDDVLVCEVSSQASTLCTEVSSGDTDPIEDVTIGDLDALDVSATEANAIKPLQNGLMSLLSGNQAAKRKPARRRNKAVLDFNEKDVSKESASLLLDPALLTSASDVSDVSDTSFDASKFQKLAEKAQAIEELERKMFTAGKGVSLRDIFKKKTGSSLATTMCDQEETSSTRQARESAPETISFLDDDEGISIVEDTPTLQRLERLFLASKSVSARNLFDSFAPKRVKKPDGEWSLKVRLRVSPDKLVAIKKFENPFTTRGNARSGDSMVSTLMQKKLSMNVFLKLPSRILEQAYKSLDPLYTKSSGSQGGKSANGVFAMMMNSTSLDGFPRLTAVQKLQGLHPPPVSRDLMHVLPNAQERPISTKAVPLTKRIIPTIDLSEETLADLKPDSCTAFNKAHLGLPRLRYDSSTTCSQRELIEENAPLAFSSSPHMKIFSRFIQDSKSMARHLNWPQKFQPTDIDSLLIDQEPRQFLKQWISNAFAVLKTQSTKTPHDVQKKEFQKRQRRRDALMHNFIVDDFEDDAESTEEDIFVSILIIEGEHGSCKSASIYAAMAAMDGYVHEINTGQARARKDVHSSLKEFCTSQIIHQNHDEKRFQKGLVLLEDCDILFEQDKTFWTTVQEVINYSRRPLVVTVKDISALPKNIVDLAEEQNSVLNLKTASADHVKQYLWLCAFSERLDLTPEVLEHVLSECQTTCGTDLRKALMRCQWMCRVRHPAIGVCRISYDYLSDSPSDSLSQLPDVDDNFEPGHDLRLVARELEAVSVSDVLETNTHSSILHDVQVNELLDIYVIDDSVHLKQRTLPHELNMGVSIRELFNWQVEPVPPPLTYNSIRVVVLDFISSRMKKIPKFIQELYGIRLQTRSRSSEAFVEERPDTQGLPELSVCYSMSSLSFLIDLAPVARYWAEFQKKIFTIDKQNKTEHSPRRLQDFLGWRRFHKNVDEVLATGFTSK